MNALMTWWAVNLTLLDSQFGNEVLSREQLLQVVPPFVAVLVWLTRILFIGAFSVAGEHFFQPAEQPGGWTTRRPLAGQRPETLPSPTLRPAAPPQQEVGQLPRRSPRRRPLSQPARPAPTLSMSAGERKTR